MQRTTAQSQQESQKTRARLALFWKPFYRRKNMRAFNVARPRQRNIYQITSTPTTCNLHAYRQASELRLNSFFISTTLLSFKQLFTSTLFGGELVGGVMVSWWRVGWWRNSLVARWPDTVTRDPETIKHRHIHIRYTSTSPLPENRKDENRKLWKLKDVKIVAAENLTYKFCTGTH